MRGKKYPISKQNEQQLIRFLQWLKANITDNQHSIEKNEVNIRKTLSLLNKDLSKVKPTDLDKVFSDIPSTGTRELMKGVFKRYLQHYHYKSLAKSIKINTSYYKKPKKTVNDVLTTEEIEQIRNSPNSNRNLAMFELMITTGICREELTLLQIQNIKILKDEIKVEIAEGKTPFRARNISIIPYPNNPCAFYPHRFVSYYENHPLKNKSEFPLFFSTDYRKPNQSFEVHAINQIFHTIRKNAKVTKKITPHILRHTCATYDGYHLPEPSLMLKFGWNNPNQARTYCHLHEEQLNGVLKQKAGLTPQIIEHESKCPYCSHTNNINAITCSNCKRTINKEEMAKQHQQQEEREEHIKTILDEQNKIINSYENRLKTLENFFHIEPEQLNNKALIEDTSNFYLKRLKKEHNFTPEQIKIIKNMFTPNFAKEWLQEIQEDAKRNNKITLETIGEYAKKQELPPNIMKKVKL